MKVKEYRASMDTTAKWVTALVLILLLGSAILIIWTIYVDKEPNHRIGALTVPLILIAIVVSYLLAPKKYLITDSQLIVERPLGKAIIQLSDIESVEQWNTMGPGITVRTFGVGGLFGYYGYYYNSNRGKLRFYATKLKSKILIVTRSKGTIVISPDDNDGMLAELKRYANH